MTKIILAWMAVLIAITSVYAGPNSSGRECREINGRMSCTKTNDSEGR